MIERIRRNPVLRKLYRLPGVGRIYHFKLALIGAIVCGFPSRNMTVVGVTGTKGKTTVAELLGAALVSAGHKAAVLSSVRVMIDGKDMPNRTSNSMPGRFFIQRFLRDARKAGCTHAVIEVTSQGVVQERHRFIEWAAAVLTNIAPEHIESHGSFENYRDAKLAFMRYALRRGATAFINADDERSKYFRDNLPEMDTVLYSTRDIAEWPAAAFAALPGEFNGQNAAAVAAVARKMELPEEAVISAFKKFKGVPGRMEFVAQSPFRVVVDYAHTPDSLEAAYKALRAGMEPEKRLIAVFGSCGGHRDKWKRPVMGEVAGRYADHIILTNEDPYDEDPAGILRDIRSGISAKAEKEVEEILDREEAIRRAVSLAQPGDTVVMTGKGSETSIHIAGDRTIEWSERRVAEEAIKNNTKQ